MALAAFLVLPGSGSGTGPGRDRHRQGRAGHHLGDGRAAFSCCFMQAGFLLLEIGFSRQKNVGAGVAKVLVNLGVATLAWWAVGFGISTLTGNEIFGTDGFFFHNGQTIGDGATPVVGGADTALMLFGMLFCAVSLAIVWGTTLERIKFAAYVIYAIGVRRGDLPAGGARRLRRRSAVRHRRQAGDGLRRFVGGPPHRCGRRVRRAAAARPADRQVRRDGKPRAIPGHSMPLVGLGVAILWVGWYGFNAGSTFGTTDNFMAEVALNTQLAAAAGRRGRVRLQLPEDEVDRRRHGRQRRDRRPGGDHRSVRLRRVLGGADHRLRRRRRRRLRRLCIEKYLDDPVGALSAHGLAGIWGTLAVGLFALAAPDPRGRCPRASTTGSRTVASAPRPRSVRRAGGRSGGHVCVRVRRVLRRLLRDQATIGLRVDEAEELAGLDISSHGMYGYPGVVHPPGGVPGRPRWRGHARHGRQPSAWEPRR